MPHGFIQAIQGKLKHGEDLLDCPNGTDIRPFMLEPGVEPRGMAEDLG
jgi:hypothetical protein